MNLYSQPQNLFVDQKTWRTLNFFWLGYIVYIFFYTFRIGESVPFVINQMFQLMGLGLIFVAGLRLIQLKFDSAYLGLVFKVYMIYLSLVVLRGYTTDYEHIKKMLFDGWFGVMIYAAPLVLLFPRNLYFYKRVFDVILILGVLTIFMYLINIGPLMSNDLKNLAGMEILETVSKSLAIPLGFVLITYMYHKPRIKILAWVVLGLTLFFAVVRARRGLIFMAMAPIMVAYIIYMYRAKVKTFIIIGSVAVGMIMADYAVTLYTESDTFRYLQQRSLEDTRSGVETMFYRGMEMPDWLFGRGMNGTYYCPGIDSGEKGGYRFVIETDYLQTILKGGLMSLGLFLIIAVPAIFYGFFQSRNTLTKAAAAWILLALINMYPSSVNTFTLNYLLVWISIGICYSPSIRRMPEQLVKAYFLNDGKPPFSG